MVSEPKSFKILLAEDNQGGVDLVREVLREHKLDCSLTVVSGGARAIELINRMDANPIVPPLDLLLLDIRLPRRDGQEVLKCLRTSQNYARTPVIIMTGMSPRVLDQEAAGRDVIYFEKPSTLDEFLQLGCVVRIFEQPIASLDDREACRGAA
jgi:CheY-like chemotaxis protein